MEVAHQRHVDAHAVELIADVRHGGGRLRRIDGDAHEFGAGHRQLLDLDGRLDRIDRVGVGHRLHPHRRIAANRDQTRAPAHLCLQIAAHEGHGRFNEGV